MEWNPKKVRRLKRKILYIFGYQSPSQWKTSSKKIPQVRILRLKTREIILVDRRNPAPVDMVNHLQGFIHPRWCRISSIKKYESGEFANISLETCHQKKSCPATFRALNRPLKSQLPTMWDCWFRISKYSVTRSRFLRSESPMQTGRQGNHMFPQDKETTKQPAFQYNSSLELIRKHF